MRRTTYGRCLGLIVVGALSLAACDDDDDGGNGDAGMDGGGLIDGPGPADGPQVDAPPVDGAPPMTDAGGDAMGGDALGSVIDRMKKHGISQLPVVEPGKLCGLVSEVKVLNALVKGEATMKSPVGPLADLDDAAMVERDTPLQTLSQHFTRGKVAVVVDRAGGTMTVAGLLTKIDLIEHMLGQ